MDEWEQKLRQWAIEAQQQTTSRRQIALNRLCRLIMQARKSGVIRCPPLHKLPPAFYGSYQEIVCDAEAKLLSEICKKIDQYQSDLPIIRWLQSLLTYRFKDVIREWGQRVVSKPIAGTNRYFLIEDLKQAEMPIKPFLSELVIQCIEEDPDGLFAKASIRGRPDANFRVIALMYHADKITLKEIAKKLQVEESALYGFYRRWRDKFAPQIKKYLEE
ncbi:MAG: hypothetical protein SFW36_11110 [Leptolyngbyaceae cyanobacterium bins.59]|nr:hypothetical protein [Leptolyngbyaceae cyanobacterium bins.59]